MISISALTRSAPFKRLLRRTSAAAVAIPAVVITSCGRPPALVKAYIGGGEAIVYYHPTRDKLVALTIDDGPDSTGTPAILDVLREHDARATFFVIGAHVRGNEALLRRTVTEGHELGNHTYSKTPSHTLSQDEFRKQFVRTDSILRTFGAAPRWFRPGSGRVRAHMLELVHAHDYRILLGDVYPLDPQIPSPGFAMDYILQNVRPGSVIILHDGGRRGLRTARTLRAVLPVLRAAGYRVVTASELFRGE